MKWLQNVSFVYKGLHEYTKAVLIFCGMYLYLTLLCCIGFYICAGRLMDYYTATEIAADLWSAFRSCVGISALGCILIESALHSE